MIVLEFLFMVMLLAVSFFVGFWCGKTYGTLDAMRNRIKKIWESHPVE